jgi:hypothetical protein
MTARGWLVIVGLAVLLGTPSGTSGQDVREPAGLTAEQVAGLAEARRLIQQGASAYGVPQPIAPRLAPWVETTGALAGAGGVSSGGRLHLGPGALTSPHRDALVAAALAYDLVRRPSRARSLADFDREQRQQFMDTHAKAVEVLTRARGWPEWTALDAVYEWLLGQHRAGVPAQETVIGRSRATPCEEIADLLGRYPAQRAWTEGLTCAGGPEAGPAAITASAPPLLLVVWSPPPPVVPPPAVAPPAVTPPPAAPGAPRVAAPPAADAPWWCAQPGHRLRYVYGCP